MSEDTSNLEEGGLQDGQDAGHAIQPFFYPDRPVLSPSPEYEQFMAVRDRILGVIRLYQEEDSGFLDDLVETLLKTQAPIPEGPLTALFASRKVVTEFRKRRRQKVVYRAVVTCLLEQVFDPLQEFKMRAKDIRDAFHAKGIARDEVSSKQIEEIYVKIMMGLKSGPLRDMMYREQLHNYVRLKIEEITFSRQDWELNHR